MADSQAIINQALSIGIKTHLWQRGNKMRIYAKTGRKDMKVYLELDGTSDCITGGALKVFCETEQHPNWIKAQVKDYRKQFIGLFHAYVVIVYAGVGPAPNGYGPDITDMINEARAFIAAYSHKD